MKYFLIVHDQERGAIELLKSFAPGSRLAALAKRFELDTRYRDNPRIEVVLLGSSSEETLRSTHARYFRPPADLAGSGAG